MDPLAHALVARRVGDSPQLSGSLVSADGDTWVVGGDIGSAQSLGQTRLLEVWALRSGALDPETTRRSCCC